MKAADNILNQLKSSGRSQSATTPSPLDALLDLEAWQRLETFLFQNQLLSSLAVPKEVNIVLSHPKTGGNTLHDAVARARRGVGQVLHTHYTVPYAANFSTSAMSSRLAGQFSDGNMEDLHRLYLHSEMNARLAEFSAHWLRTHVPLPLGGLLPANVYDRERRSALPRTNIIISLREPVSCCLSGYFQIMFDTSAKDLPNEKVHEDLTRLFRQTFPLNQLHWWNMQVKKFFGSDFLELEFDRGRGWHHYHFPGVSFLVIRQENFQDAPVALAKLFDMPAELVEIGRENAAADKREISALYSRAKEGLRFDKEQLDQLYDNVWFRHFYTSEEEKEFRSVWMR